MIAIPEKITVDEFESRFLRPEDSNRLLELIYGVPQEKMPTEEHGIIATNIAFLLKLFARKAGKGRVGVEVRHRAPSDKHNSRLPDVSYSTAEREIIRKGTVPEMPDLAVEIKSPSDTIAEMRKTAAFYLQHGSLRVWLVFPHKQIVEVYRNDADIEILTSEDRLVDEALFPAYEFPIAEFFE